MDKQHIQKSICICLKKTDLAVSQNQANATWTSDMSTADTLAGPIQAGYQRVWLTMFT